MDRISCCVLDKICTLAPLGRYVVFSADELFEAFPDDEEATMTELKKAVKALTADGYIDLKYQDGEFFCAAPIKKPRPAPPRKRQHGPLSRPKKQNKPHPLPCFLRRSRAARSAVL